MNPFTSNLPAAQLVARRTMADCADDAEQRRQASAARTARRAARQAARRADAKAPHDLPLWAFRFMYPVR
jgi:hypothetical protein